MSGNNETVGSSYGSPDCYGRDHHDDGDTKWPMNQQDCEDITPYDALVLGELSESFAPSTGLMSIHSLPGGQLVPRRGVVTSPNVSWLPYITVTPLPVRARANGRFAHADFTICPQWWFSKTAHLAFVLWRPLEQDINKHPLYWLWWDVKPRHFKPVEGSAFNDLGILDEQIANVMSFQRLYMETLAMVDWFKTWEARLLEPNRQVYPVDESVMGAITDSLKTAETLFRIGAPVWLVRTPAEIPPRINILNVRPPTPKNIATLHDRRPFEVDPLELCLDDYPNHPFPNIMTASPRSTHYIQACQAHFEGCLGPEDPKPVVKEPQSGSLSVEPGTGPSRTDRDVVRPSPYSNPSSSTKAAGSISGANVNREKFREIEETFIPPQSPVWKKGLLKVNPDLSRIKVSKDRWLQSFTSLDNSPMPAPHTQHWRNFLYRFSKEMNLVDAARAEELSTSQPSQKGKTPAKGTEKSRRRMFKQQFSDPELKIFPEDDDGYIVGRMPENNVGLVVENWRDRVRSVEALRIAPHTQHWRDFLYRFSKEMDLVDASRAEEPPTSQLSQKGKTPAKGGRKSEKSKQKYAMKRGESLKNAQTSLFGPRVKVGERPHSIFWRDVSVMEGNSDNLTPAISAEILWNLFEQNFRLELRMVDQQVLPADWASQESAAVRDELVRRTFPEDDDGYIVGRLPETNVGLVAENWRDRVRSVEALRVLITGWPGPDAHALASMSMFDGCGKLTTTWAHFERVEEMAVGLYCQMFFDYFGHAPSTLHRIPTS
ncbi:hypothetical protein K443DRAFT_126241 [Laccaria amethystina LaAM-08-1]|uniref:Uncharacterized protein n=1 Tax=Laccaria amethystina LaAM-08-1 TaxID=1095629 RepID=A0A0C9X1F3_9AGAR|nr:hypothetical protein K443DRAFT_126241 [Laccaria amethystina LaAM-08-1]